MKILSQPDTYVGGSISVDDNGESLTVDIASGQIIYVQPSGTFPVSGTVSTTLAGTLPVSGSIKIIDSVGNDLDLFKPNDNYNAADHGLAILAVDEGTPSKYRMLRCSTDGDLFTHLRAEDESGELAFKNLDADTGAGTVPISVLGIALPSAGGPVIGGTSGNPFWVKQNEYTEGVSGTISVGNTVAVSGTISANPLGTQGVSGTVSIGSTTAVSGNINLPNVSAVSGNINLPNTSAVSGSINIPSTVGVSGTVSDAVQAATFISKTVDFPASQTGATIWTPTSGKKFVICDIVCSASAAGAITIFDGTDSTTYRVAKFNLAANGGAVINYAKPYVSAAANNVLKYTTGTVIAGSLTVSGYEV